MYSTLNDSLNATAEPPRAHCYDRPPLSLTTGANVAAVVLYSAISIVAIGGNSIVVFIILKFQRLRTPTNLLILNLALADLLMAVFCIPFTYWAYLILTYWPFGLLACVGIHYVQTVAVMLASYTLVAISIDRMLAILFPLSISVKLTERKASVVIFVTWLVSMGIATPILFVQRTRPLNNHTTIELCEETWSASHALAYGQALLILQYLLPLAVLVVTYSGIVINLWQHTGDLGSENKQVARDRKENVKKMIPMMILVSVLYGACWLPQNLLMNLLMDRIPCLPENPYIYYIYWGVHMTAMSHSVVNPVIYYWRNSRFRAGFIYVFSQTRLVSMTSRTESELNSKKAKATYSAQMQHHRLQQARAAEARLKSYGGASSVPSQRRGSTNRPPSTTRLESSSTDCGQDDRSATKADSTRALLADEYGALVTVEANGAAGGPSQTRVIGTQL